MRLAPCRHGAELHPVLDDPELLGGGEILSAREFRRLWIQRINAACRQHDMSYSRIIAGLKAAEVEVDRKMLADIAVTDPAAFESLVKVAAEALENTAAAS